MRFNTDTSDAPDSPPQGCRFHPRCSFARDVCRTTVPPQVHLDDGDGPAHVASCHFAHEIAAGSLTPTRDTAGDTGDTAPAAAAVTEPHGR